MKKVSFVFLATLLVFLFSGCNKKTEKTSPNAQDKLNEQQIKVYELQRKVDEQQIEISQLRATAEEQGLRLAGQENKSNIQDNSVANSSSDNLEKYHQCNIDINKYCTSESFRKKSELEKMLESYKENFGDNDYEKYKNKFTKQFDNCQKALKCE